MSSLLRQHRGGVAFLQLGLELGWLVAAVVLAVRYQSALSSLSVVTPALVFAVLMVGLNAAFGLYRRDRRPAFGEYAVRQSAALAIGLPVAYLSSHILPGGVFFQEAFGPVVLIAFAIRIVNRHRLTPARGFAELAVVSDEGGEELAAREVLAGRRVAFAPRPPSRLAGRVCGPQLVLDNYPGKAERKHAFGAGRDRDPFVGAGSGLRHA